jgi:hypothetical protein
MKPPTIPTPFDLAKEFSRVIRDTLSLAQLAECVRRNAANPDPAICHSHDFCDANMAMAEAWENLSSIPCGADCPDEVNAVWNHAWDIAKDADFTL